MNEGGKGSTPRPLSVSMEEFDRNFDAIFGAKKKEPIPFGGHIDLELTRDEKEIIVKNEWRF